MIGAKGVNKNSSDVGDFAGKPRPSMRVRWAMLVQGWVKYAIEIPSYDVAGVFIGKVGKVTFSDVTKTRRSSSRHRGRVDRKNTKCRGFRESQDHPGDEAFMVVIWNRGGIFCYPAAEDNGRAVSMVHHVPKDLCFVETNRKLVREEGQSGEFLEEDYVITRAEKM